MSRSSRLILAGITAAVVASCDPGLHTSRTDGDDEGTDRQSEELAAIPQQPSANVCNFGKYRCKSKIRTASVGGPITPFAVPTGFGPADLASAYNLSGSGTGTIAIVDAFGYPNAESDLATYRSQFGLPPCTTANGCF